MSIDTADKRYFIAVGYNKWWEEYSRLPRRPIGDGDEVRLDPKTLLDLSVWVKGVGDKSNFGCFIPSRFIAVTDPHSLAPAQMDIPA